MRTGASLSDLTETGKQFGIAAAVFERIVTTSTDIAVWQARLDVDATDVVQCFGLLSDDEKLRAGRFRFERDQRRFIVARGRLRLLLGEQSGLAPAAVNFCYTRHGKPFMANHPAGIYFNVAHSHERVLYAVSRAVQPGVDIEFVNREIECDQLAQRFFTRNEHTALQKLPAAIRKRAFLACWTRKEAILKATGDGLSLPLDQFEVTVEPDVQPRIIAVHAQRIANCSLYAADVGADYLAAVASYTGPTPEEHDTHLTE